MSQASVIKFCFILTEIIHSVQKELLTFFLDEEVALFKKGT